MNYFELGFDGDHDAEAQENAQNGWQVVSRDIVKLVQDIFLEKSGRGSIKTTFNFAKQEVYESCSLGRDEPVHVCTTAFADFDEAVLHEARQKISAAGAEDASILRISKQHLKPAGGS